MASQYVTNYHREDDLVTMTITQTIQRYLDGTVVITMIFQVTWIRLDVFSKVIIMTIKDTENMTWDSKVVITMIIPVTF